MSRQQREKWEVCFSQIGLTYNQLMQMSNEEFYQKCDYIRDELKMPCPPPEPSQNPKRKPGRTDSGLIRDQQNEEYLRMQMEMKQKENRKKAEEQKKKEQEAEAKKSQEESKNDKINAAKQLGQGPADGVQICINMPSGKRIIRKYDKTHLCDELFTLVTGQEEMFDGLESIPYKLMMLNKEVKKGVTFQDAGIKVNTMITVMEEDEDEEDDDDE